MRTRSPTPTIGTNSEYGTQAHLRPTLSERNEYERKILKPYDGIHTKNVLNDPILLRQAEHNQWDQRNRLPYGVSFFSILMGAADVGGSSVGGGNVGGSCVEQSTPVQP